MQICSMWILLALFVSCRPDRGTEKSQTGQDWSKNHSVDFNREVNEREQLEISAFLKHHYYLKMQTSVSGLRYMIYKKSNGARVKSGADVSVKMKIERLDGTLCYQTDSAQKEENIIIGKSHLESGIQEGIKLMRVGEQAKFILPSYLGHGLLGDRYTIPPQEILYVDVELIRIK
ncbi:MAG: hypothetical protein FJX80_06880 [Bacteroidetes bacterium]|nr:hypothetical protein [Bacteroidota bacterium]